MAITLHLQAKHLNYASNKSNANTLPSINGLSPRQAFDATWKHVKEKQRYKIVKRKKGRPALTLRLRMYFPPRFFEMSRDKPKKPAWLRHEAVHGVQWRRWGAAKFAWRYAHDPRWRWAVEVQAECETMKTLSILGESEKYLRGRAKRSAKKFSSLTGTYRLGFKLRAGKFNVEQGEREAEKMLLAAAGLK